MKSSRFERKILAAIVVAAVMPLLGALLLGQGVLREAYAVGVNGRVRAELERGLGLYREHFVVLRKRASEVVLAVSRDVGIAQALARNDNSALQARLVQLMADYDDVSEIEVRDAQAQLVAHSVQPQRAGPSHRLLRIAHVIEPAATTVPGDQTSGSSTVQVTVATEVQPFIDYQRAGELAGVYRRLEHGTGQVAGFYIIVYMGFLLSVIVVALAVGIVISRRVTRRIAVLAQATRRVGAGDLGVQVPTELSDEIGELTRDFNEMVHDLRESRDRIDYLQRIGAWQEFARRLAHEIKNPLTPIQLAIQEVQRSYTGEDRAFGARLDTARHIIEEEVATLRRLTGEFSTFARLPEATLAPADLRDFIQDSALSLAAIVDDVALQGGAIELKLQPAKELLPARIDAMMLKRALDNLVRNAAQALRDHHAGEPSPAAGQLQLVLVQTSKHANEVWLEIADSGPGIMDSDRERVFDPYFTTKQDGTGLGLPIVKKVVLEHHGEIECLVSEFGGALFRIRLPLRRD